MTGAAVSLSTPRRLVARAVFVTWLVTAAWDFLCASALAVFAYGSTLSRFWQGVATTVLGASALEMGAQGVAAGLVAPPRRRAHVVGRLRPRCRRFGGAPPCAQSTRRCPDSGDHLRATDLARDVARGDSPGDGTIAGVRVPLVGADHRARAVRHHSARLHRAARPGTRRRLNPIFPIVRCDGVLVVSRAGLNFPVLMLPARRGGSI